MAGHLYYVTVSGVPSEDEDVEIPGTYDLEVPDGFPEEHRVSAVLDTFHCRVPVASLDDFDIEVRDADGNVLAEPAAGESYRFNDAAEFLGRSEPPSPGPA